MKVLFVRRLEDVFTTYLKENLERNNIKVDVLDLPNHQFIKNNSNFKIFKKRIKYSLLTSLIIFVRRIISALILLSKVKEQYDFIHIFNWKIEKFLILPLLLRKSKKNY